MMRVMLALAATLMAASCSNEVPPTAGQTPPLPNNADIVPGAGPLPEPPPAPPDKPPPQSIDGWPGSPAVSVGGVAAGGGPNSGAPRA